MKTAADYTSALSATHQSVGQPIILNEPLPNGLWPDMHLVLIETQPGTWQMVQFDESKHRLLHEQPEDSPNVVEAIS